MEDKIKQSVPTRLDSFSHQYACDIVYLKVGEYKIQIFVPMGHTANDVPINYSIGDGWVGIPRDPKTMNGFFA